MQIKQIDSQSLYEVHTVSDDMYTITVCYPIDHDGNPDPLRRPKFLGQVMINHQVHKFEIAGALTIRQAIDSFDSSIHHYINDLKSQSLRSQLTAPLKRSN